MTRRGLWLAIAAVLAGGVAAVGQTAGNQPALGTQAASATTAQSAGRVPTIVLERSEMLAGERVPVRVVFADPASAPAITQLCLRLLGPAYLSLEGGPVPDRSLPDCPARALGPFRVDQPLTFDLVAGAGVREGKVTVVFDLSFDEGRPRRVGLEKTLDVGVFGIGAISGVPLQLAVLILPGVAALAVARVFGVGWVGALQTLEAGALAFGLSAILASGFDVLLAVQSSALRVLMLIGLGLVLGGVFAVMSILAKRHERATAAAEAEAATVGPQDDFGTAIAKALRLNARRLDPELKTVVRLADGRRLEGSLAAPISAGGVVVLGWGAVDATAQTKAALDKALAAGKWDALSEQLAAALAAKQASVRLLERVRVYDSQMQPVEADRSAMVRVPSDQYSAEERHRAGSRDSGQMPIRGVTLRERGKPVAP